MPERSLYERLGGYDAIAAVAENLLPEATAQRGMKISLRDGSAFSARLRATRDAFRVPPVERDAVIGFVESTKPDIVEA